MMTNCQFTDVGKFWQTQHWMFCLFQKHIYLSNPPANVSTTIAKPKETVKKILRCFGLTVFVQVMTDTVFSWNLQETFRGHETIFITKINQLATELWEQNVNNNKKFEQLAWLAIELREQNVNNNKKFEQLAWLATELREQNVNNNQKFEQLELSFWESKDVTLSSILLTTYQAGKSDGWFVCDCQTQGGWHFGHVCIEVCWCNTEVVLCSESPWLHCTCDHSNII